MLLLILDEAQAMVLFARAGDLMKSMQVLVYKAEDGVLEVRAQACAAHLHDHR